MERRVALPVRVQSVSVDAADDGSYFDISISPYNCADNFYMLSIYNAPEKAGDTGRPVSRHLQDSMSVRLLYHMDLPCRDQLQLCDIWWRLLLAIRC